MGNIRPVVAVADDNREMMVRGPTKKLFVSLTPSTVYGRRGAEYSNREYCPVLLVEIERHGTSVVTLAE